MSDERARERAFGEALQAIRREAREQGGRIGSGRVREIFAPFALEEKQLEEVFAYLRADHVGVDEDAPEAEEYLSAREKDYLADYLATLGALPHRTEREKLRLAQRAMAGDAEAQKGFAECLLPLVPDIARLYVEQGVFLEDLIGEGNVALYQGVTLLGALEDPVEAERAVSRHIMDAMEALIEETFHEDARGQRAVDRVNEVADRARELFEALRRPVTVEELMGETGWTRDKIMEAWKLSGGGIEELEMPGEK